MRKILPHLFVAGLILSSTAWCGTGSYTAGDPDLVGLNVRFEYEEPDPRTWEPLFKEASRLLFDATEKQVKISKVVFYNNCPSTANKSDVRIFDDNADAITSKVGGLGQPKLFIRLSQFHKTVADPNVRGQFGLLHELGHYVFALLDEYKDKEGKISPAAGCVVLANGDIDKTASIMDGGTTENNERTEFCFADNHHTGKTEQDQSRMIGTQTFENKDSWTWLAACP